MTTTQQKKIMAESLLHGPATVGTGYPDATITYTDMLSEGPIEGLVYGPASVYLEGQQLMHRGASPSKYATGSSRINISNNTIIATIETSNATDLALFSQLNKARKISVLAGRGSISVSARQTAYNTDSGNTLPSLELRTSGSSFFTDDMVFQRLPTTSTVYHFEKDDIRSTGGVYLPNNTISKSARVQYLAPDPNSPIGGLVSGQFYYWNRSPNYVGSPHVRLWPDTAAGKTDAQFGSTGGALNLYNQPGVAGVQHKFVETKIDYIYGTREKSAARLEGNALSGFEDLNGIITKRISDSRAIFTPGDGVSASTGLPEEGTYTLAIDATVDVTPVKDVSLFTGLTQGALLVSHTVKNWVQNSKSGNWSWAGIDGETTSYRLKNLQWPAPPNKHSLTFNPNEDVDYPLITNYNFPNFQEVGDTGFLIIGYFKPPSTGEYHFQIRGYNMNVWLGGGAEENLTRNKDNTLMTTHVDRQGSNKQPMNHDSERTRNGYMYLNENTYYPIRITMGMNNNHRHYAKNGGYGNHYFKWRKFEAGQTLSSDLTQHFYYPPSYNWVGAQNATISPSWDYPSGTFKYNLQEAEDHEFLSANGLPTLEATGKGNFKNSSVQFRVGNQYQTPIVGELGDKSTQVGITNIPQPTSPLELHTDFVVDFAKDNENNENQGVSETIVQAIDENGLNLSEASLAAVDEVVLNFDYPNGLRQNKNNGGIEHGFAYYELSIAIKEPGATDFSDPFLIERFLRHSAKTNSARIFPVRLDVGKLRPFDDFKIIIKRRSVHSGVGYEGTGISTIGKRHEDSHKIQATAKLGLCTSYLNYKLSYPYTAYAKTTFNTTEFQQTPKRFYHLKGMKVKIPTNYVTREASSSGIAKYTRNSSGVDTGTYVDWDGTLTDDLHYTNNPAWIFYDILTNKRVGLGAFVDAEDIDIYSLYRISRYCDELVDDGSGGLEPRFTSNIYLTKTVACYKLLKDFATSFRAMLYWHNGKLTPVVDQEKDPVYNFTQGNVIDGVFSYESSGSKTRANQIVVSWNNPRNSYKVEGLLVEDKENVIETGKIIMESSVAFGCTSQKQAERYGRWKLWTAKNQKEIVSFQAYLEAQFLSPGDIISVSDADRKKQRFAGRISSDSTKTLSTTTIPLDANLYINPSNNYKLLVSFGKPGALLTQDDTVIFTNAAKTSSITYKRGEYIPFAWVNTGSGYTYQAIDTEEKAANAKAERLGLNSISLFWSDSVISEERDVVIPGGHTVSTALTSITVSSAYSETPKRNAIWLLEERGSTTIETTASAKMYKILNLTYDKENIASIIALEHYNEKFADIETTDSYAVTGVDDLSVGAAPGQLEFKDSNITEVPTVTTDPNTGQTITIHTTTEHAPMPPITDLFFEVVEPEGTY